MKAKRISPSEMARRMRTSRQAVYRLLDPTRTGVTLGSLQRAASALGLNLNISFEPPAGRSATRPHGLAAGGRSEPRESILLTGAAGQRSGRGHARGKERVEIRSTDSDRVDEDADAGQFAVLAQPVDRRRAAPQPSKRLWITGTARNSAAVRAAVLQAQQRDSSQAPTLTGSSGARNSAALPGVRFCYPGQGREGATVSARDR
jgi:hypothetical protein